MRGDRMEEAPQLGGARVSLIVAVFNEMRTLPTILERVLSAPFRKEVIIVDDGSTDGSRQYLERLGDKEVAGDAIKVLFHVTNRGKGAAVRTGLAHVTGEYVVIQDADLEYDPKEIPFLLGPIADGRADVVYGSRFLGGPHRVFYFWHAVGNKIVTLIANLITGFTLTDVCCGYKGFRASVLKSLTLRSDRFQIDAEITAKLLRHPLRVYEVPISYSGRTYEEGKKIKWKDAFPLVWALIRFRFFD